MQVVDEEASRRRKEIQIESQKKRYRENDRKISLYSLPEAYIFC